MTSGKNGTCEKSGKRTGHPDNIPNRNVEQWVIREIRGAGKCGKKYDILEKKGTFDKFGGTEDSENMKTERRDI